MWWGSGGGGGGGGGGCRHHPRAQRSSTVNPTLWQCRAQPLPTTVNRTDRGRRRHQCKFTYSFENRRISDYTVNKFIRVCSTCALFGGFIISRIQLNRSRHRPIFSPATTRGRGQPVCTPAGVRGPGQPIRVQAVVGGPGRGRCVCCACTQLGQLPVHTLRPFCSLTRFHEGSRRGRLSSPCFRHNVANTRSSPCPICTMYIFCNGKGKSSNPQPLLSKMALNVFVAILCSSNSYIAKGFHMDPCPRVAATDRIELSLAPTVDAVARVPTTNIYNLDLCPY